MLRTIFILVILIPGFFWALRDRFVALLLYIWFALFRPQEWVWIDISALRISLVLGMVLIIPCLLSGRWPDLSHPLSKIVFFILIFALLTQINAINPVISGVWTEQFSRLVFVSLIMIRLISTTRDLMAVVVVIACSLGFHTAKMGLGSILGGGIQFIDGIGGAFATNNGLGMGAAMIVPFLVNVGQLLTYRWLRLGFFTAALLSMYTVISTFSRGALLGLLTGVIVFILVQKKHRIKIIAGLLMIGILAYAFVPLPAGYADRFATIQETVTASEGQEIERSAQSRSHIWEVAIIMLYDYPLGVGFQGFSDLYNFYDFSNGRYGMSRDVHSSYLQMFTSLGLAGGLLFTWTLLYTCLILVRVHRRVVNLDIDEENHRIFLFTANCLLTSMSVFMVGGIFGSYALNDLTWYTIALTVSIDRLSVAFLKQSTNITRCSTFRREVKR